jgi:hypothetical protein
MRSLVILASLLSFATSACGTGRGSMLCGDISPPPSATGDAAALEATGDAAWARREDEAQARAAIAAWQEALRVVPNNPALRAKLARGHYFLADSVLWFGANVDESEAAATEMAANYREAANQAELSLGQGYAGYRTKFCARQPFAVALEQLDAKAVPALYWYAASLSRWALMVSLLEVLDQTDRIKAMMAFIKQAQPDYWYGAADRYLGGYNTKIPLPSGNLPVAREHFEASLKAGPNYLATKVIMAEMYATKAGDRDLFKRLLDEVIAFNLDDAPELRAENAAEQRKAKVLLADIDNLVEDRE